jgi:hypothetical protein
MTATNAVGSGVVVIDITALEMISVAYRSFCFSYNSGSAHTLLFIYLVQRGRNLRRLIFRDFEITPPCSVVMIVNTVELGYNVMRGTEY